jgi:ABC-2 type transport system ATP-binding protein
VHSYLTFVAKLKGVPRGEVAAARDRVIERTGLAEVSHRLLSHLSKGFRQRVGLGQALIHNPQVLVLDEPTIGLDPRQIIEIRSLIKELAGNRTVILSTHILPEVSQVCDKVVIINDGRIACEDTIENLTRDATLEEVFLRYISQDTAAHAEGASESEAAEPVTHPGEAR